MDDVSLSLGIVVFTVLIIALAGYFSERHLNKEREGRDFKKVVNANTNSHVVSLCEVRKARMKNGKS